MFRHLLWSVEDGFGKTRLRKLSKMWPQRWWDTDAQKHGDSLESTGLAEKMQKVEFKGGGVPLTWTAKRKQEPKEEEGVGGTRWCHSRGERTEGERMQFPVGVGDRDSVPLWPMNHQTHSRRLFTPGLEARLGSQERWNGATGSNGAGRILGVGLWTSRAGTVEPGQTWLRLRVLFYQRSSRGRGVSGTDLSDQRGKE